MAGSDDVSIRVGADTTGLESALRSSASVIQSFAAGAQGSIGGLGGVFTGLTGSIGGVGIALGGVTAVLGAAGAAIEGFGGRATEIKTMSDTIGVTTSQFQALEVAADATGVSMDKVARVAEKLNILLNDARNGSGAAIVKLHELHITNQQIADSQFKVNDLMGMLHARLLDTNTAEATSNALKKEFGVRGAQVVEVLKGYDGSAQAVAKVMAAINGLSEGQNEQLVKAYGAWKLIGTEIKNAGAALTLWGIEAGKYLDKPLTPPTPPPAPARGTIDRRAVAAQDAEQVVQEEKKAAEEKIRLSHEVTEAVLKDEQHQISEAKQGSAERLALTKQHFIDSLEYYGKDVAETRAAGLELVNEERSYQAKREAEAKAAAAKRLAIEKEGTAAIKAETAITVIEINRAIAESGHMLDTMKKVRESESQAFNDMTLGEIAAREKGLSEELRDGQISATQYLVQERTLIDQRLAEWRRFYGVKSGLAAGDAVEESQAATGVAKATASALKERQLAENASISASLTQWRAFSTAIESSVTHAISGMIQGTMTFANAMRSIFTSVIDHIIQQMVRWLGQTIENALIQSAVTKAAGAEQIATGAGVAAVNAGASVAAIPFWGWIAAAGVMAATFALAKSYSAAEGFDIPDISPLVQLHPQEMVLPKEHADTIRSMRGGQGGGPTTFYISALDARSVQQLLTDHRGFVAQTLRDHMRSRR